MTCTGESTSHSIYLKWPTAKPTKFSEIDGYNVKYRIIKTKKFSNQQIDDPFQRSTLLEGLKSDSEYEIKVYGCNNGDEEEFFTNTVRTDTSMAKNLKLLSEENDKKGENMKTYNIKPEDIIDLGENVRCCNMISDYDEDEHEEKTIMLLGETGSGKSTMIDAMFNYMAGVSVVDDFRLKLVHLTDEEKIKSGKQDVSQTNGITCYRIPWKKGSTVNCKLSVIDTPGFNDTRGSEQDEKIPEMVKTLFQKGIKFIDALCLVVNVTRVRITDVEKYVFSSILELFAKDISNNIFLFLTHDDGAKGDPAILDSLRKNQINIKKAMYFRFNNANLFKTEHSEEVWKVKNDSFGKFFAKLLHQNTKSISLSKTKEVLDSRIFLEIQLEKIQTTIGSHVTTILNIKDDETFIATHEKDIENNKNFTKTVEVDVPITIEHAHKSLNCNSCKETCHEKCYVPAGWLIWTCEAMSGSKCRICKGKCDSSKHKMEKFSHSFKPEPKIETLKEMKARYDVAKTGTEGRKEMMKKNEANLQKSSEELIAILKQVDEKITTLKTVALKPSFISTKDYLDKVIAKESKNMDQNTYKRIEILTNLKQTVP